MDSDNKEGQESSGIDETQNTSSENNAPVENKETVDPAKESENKEGQETSGVDDTQNTGSENNALVEKETVNPATDSNTVNNNVQDVRTDVTAKVEPISEVMPVRNIPLTSQPADDAVEMTHQEAVMLDNVNVDAVFETVDSVGRGSGPRFNANTDPDRPVKTYLPKKGEFVIVPIGRNSGKTSEGGLVGSTTVELGFSFRFFSAKHKDQVGFVLVNGKELIGYVLKGEAKGGRRAFYFPKNEAEKVIALPQRGKQIKLQVAKLLVG